MSERFIFWVGVASMVAGIVIGLLYIVGALSGPVSIASVVVTDGGVIGAVSIAGGVIGGGATALAAHRRLRGRT